MILLLLHDGGSGLRLNDDNDIKFSSMGQCLMSMAGSAVSQLGDFFSSSIMCVVSHLSCFITVR